MKQADETQRIADACMGDGRHAPHQLLIWLVADVLAGFGVRCNDTAPLAMRDWLRDVSGLYARAVERRPFDDLLGEVYQSLSSRGHRGHLGQFFTPGPVCTMMNMMLNVGAGPVPIPDAEDGRLMRMMEPACGSGAQVLAFMRTVVDTRGQGALKRWSITAIDLDHLCANMCATQVLANLCMGQIELGELLVYRGDALDDIEKLDVVVHTTTRDLTPDLVLPARHPSRLYAVRKELGPTQRESDQEGGLSEAVPRQSPASRRATAKQPVAATPPAHAASQEVAGQIDLFGD